MISSKTIEEVFEVAIIEDVISEFVVLKKSGANFKGLSPFSNEKTPSFMVSPSKRIWKDFSSGKGGNVVSFLMEHEKYSYPEAIKYLAKKYNIEIEETQKDSFFDENKEQKESTMVLIEFASKFFTEKLFNSNYGKDEVLTYLYNRGFDEEVIKKFEIGYAPSFNKELSNLVLQKGFKKEVIENTGLFLVKDSRSLTDRFSGRLMFPIYNLLGRKVGFGGRTLSKEKKIAKYINSPETIIYQKSKILYGLNFAKTEIIKKDECFLVEGYTDLISLYQKGIKNVVASSGTAITIDQVRLVKRFTKNVSFIFDSDEAGENAVDRAINLFLSEELFINIISLPNGSDPDSFAKKNTLEDICNYFNENKQDFISYKCRNNNKDSNPKFKIELINSILNSISKVPNITTQAVYLQSVSEKLGINENMLFNELQSKFKKDKKQNSNKNTLNKKENTNKDNFLVSIEERTLSRLLLNYGQKLITIKSGEISVSKLIINELTIDGISFSHTVLQKIIKEYQEFINQGKIPEIHYFTQHSDPKVAQLTSELMLDKHKIDRWDKKNIRVKKEEDILSQLVQEALIRFKIKRIGEMKKIILENLPSLNEEIKKEELIKFNKLNLLYRELYSKIGREC